MAESNRRWSGRHKDNDEDDGMDIDRQSEKYEDSVNSDRLLRDLHREAGTLESNVGKKRISDESEENMPSKQKKKGMTLKATSPTLTKDRASSDKSAISTMASPHGSIVNTDRNGTYPRIKIKYDKHDLGPYKAIVIKKFNKDSPSPRKLSNVAIGRLITKAGISFTLVERTGRNKWLITFASRSEANKAIDNTLVQRLDLDLWVPYALVYRKAVLQGIDEDIPIDEISEEFRESNPGLRASDFMRLKKRITRDGVSELVDSQAVKISLRASSCPSHVCLWRVKVPITPFVPTVRVCYKCGMLNHSTRACTAQEKCLNCGEDKHEEGNACQGPTRCMNCKGNHRTHNRECPEIVKKREVTKIMAVDNVDYLTAKRIYEDRQPRSIGVSHAMEGGMKSYSEITKTGSLSPRAGYQLELPNSNLSKEAVSSIRQLLQVISKAPSLDKLMSRLIQTCNLHLNTL